MIIVKPEKTFEHAQFEPRKKAGTLTEGLLFFNSIWGLYTVCELTIKDGESKKVVLTAEMPANPGTSITRIADKIATFVYNELLRKAAPDNIIWIEKYNPKSLLGIKGRETFFLVTYRWKREGRLYIYSDPKRKRISKEQVAFLSHA